VVVGFAKVFLTRPELINNAKAQAILCLKNMSKEMLKSFQYWLVRVNQHSSYLPIKEEKRDFAQQLKEILEELRSFKGVRPLHTGVG